MYLDMASIEKALNKSFFESILPEYGHPRVKIPTWNEGQKMFICDEYVSASGNRYYRGIRFSNNVVVVETIGLYHSWTYIDSIELYAFNGEKLELVQKEQYDKKFRNEEFVRSETERLLKAYLQGVAKLQNNNEALLQIEEYAQKIMDGCYKSILDDDYNLCLTKIIPQIEHED